MHVPAAVRGCHSDSCCHCLASNQVSVKEKRSAQLSTTSVVGLVTCCVTSWKCAAFLKIYGGFGLVFLSVSGMVMPTCILHRTRYRHHQQSVCEHVAIVSLQ
uniref:Uncharacterized protein n=1 Tax=Arundo donax TaxID=35708 RepID=A0A0A9B6W7_ARUDO